jgi:hypothetical protein
LTDLHFHGTTEPLISDPRSRGGNVRKLALAVTAASLVFGSTAGSAGGVDPHRHCLLTPQGFVEVAPGVVEHAPHETAFHKFHSHVHLGAPPTTIIPQFDLTAACP